MNLILHIPTTHSGGTENYVLRWLRWLRLERPHWRVQVWCNEAFRGVLHEPICSTGADVIYFRGTYFSPLRALAMRRQLYAFSADAYCNFSGPFSMVGLLIARGAGVRKRVVWHRRADYPVKAWWKVWGFNGLMRISERLATQILSNSTAALDVFHPHRDRTSSKYRVIFNGIPRDPRDPDVLRRAWRSELGLQDSEVVIGHVGRWSSVKNHRFLFALVAQLRAQGVPVKLVLCGLDTNSADCARSLEMAGIAEITIVLGEVDDVRGLYPAFDVFVFPSISESFPNALLEALLAGVPVWPSDIPPHREICHHSQTVYLPISDLEGAVKIALQEIPMLRDKKASQFLDYYLDLTKDSSRFADFLSSFEG